MGLFKRTTVVDDETPRCPTCRERIPQDAVVCAMCGRDLAGVDTGAERARETTAEEVGGG